MSNPTPSGQTVRVKDNDRIYQGLGHLHRGEHLGDDCFCTTEISGVYRVVLDEVNSLINAHIVSVLEQLKADFNDGKNSHSVAVINTTIDAAIAKYKQEDK